MKIRCFIAINLPDQVKEELAKIINQLKKKNSNWSINYVKPESLHLTLHFLGSIDENQIETAKKIIKDTVVNFQIFGLETGDFLAFPNLNNPRVLFIESAGETKAAAAIQKIMGDKLSNAGFFLESRVWKPHLTLARIKAPVKLILDEIKLPILKFSVSSVELMKSQLSRNGSVYSVLASYNLNYEN